MQQIIYENPYCLSEDQLKKLAPNRPSEIDVLKADFDENGILKFYCQFRKDIRSGKIMLSDESPVVNKNEISDKSIEQYKKLEDKIQALKITRTSKEKLRYFVKYLGEGEKPYSVEEFRRLGGDYLTQFLNPAIEAGIIIKTGNQKSAKYRVNY